MGASARVKPMTAHPRFSFRALDPDWERPSPSPRELRWDYAVWLVVLAGTLLMVSAYHSTGVFGSDPGDIRNAYIAHIGMTLPLLLRRRFPLTMLILGTVFFYCLGFLNNLAAATIGYQVSYLAVIYAAVAWGKNRSMLWIIYAMVCLSVLVWLVSLWAINGSAFSLFNIDDYQGGLFDVPTASYISTFLSNLIFFGFGAVLGRSAWIGAYQRSVLEQQQAQLQRQSEQLAEDAVNRDRLRIARELHDSVGHHVSAMGIQAAAARRALTKKPELASQPLENVEKLARSSVDEMKSIIRVLRSDSGEQAGASAEPGVRDIVELVDQLSDSGIVGKLQVDAQSEARLGSLAQGTQLSIYRIVQEALTNVRKHSTARSVLVVLRTVESAAGGWVELEVTDDGRVSSAVSGRGYGLQGIRERAEVLGGTADLGPRQGTDGWKVRVRFPADFQTGQ